MKYRIPILLVLSLIVLTSLVTAIGVTPPRVVIDEVLKGSSVEQSVRLVDIEKGTLINAQISGEGSEWISIKGGNEFIFSEETEEIIFLLDVPNKAPNGNYTILAQFVASSSSENKENSNTASVLSGVMVEISFSVSGDENKDYSIRKIFIPDFEIGDPLTVIIDIKNNGNVIARPDKVEIDIKDKISREIILSDETNAVGNIDPFQVGESIAAFKVDLTKDLYFGDVKVHTNNGIIEEKDIPFDILPPGSLAASGELSDLFVQDNVESLAKITSIFKNTGENGLNTLINLEIYANGVLKDTIKTDAQYVRGNSEQEFIYSYTVKEKGEYTIKAYAEFNGKKSDTEEVSFKANPPGGFLSDLPIMEIVLGILILIAAYFIYVKIKTKKRKNASGKWEY